MQNGCVKELGNDKDQGCPLLTRPEQKTTKCASVTHDEGSFSLVRSQFLLVGHVVSELLHHDSLELLVPPGFEAAICRVKGTSPLILVAVYFVSLVDEECCKQNCC